MESSKTNPGSAEQQVVDSMMEESGSMNISGKVFFMAKRTSFNICMLDILLSLIMFNFICGGNMKK